MKRLLAVGSAGFFLWCRARASLPSTYFTFLFVGCRAAGLRHAAALHPTNKYFMTKKLVWRQQAKACRHTNFYVMKYQK